MLAGVWGLAALGIGVKLFWMGAPRWLSVSFYVLMGWLVVAAFYPLVQSTPPTSVTWLVAGGLIYTLGAVVYATKRPNPLPGRFGFHEIWHLFVLAGSISHFIAVYYLVG
jgi:hemolysin III